MKIFITGIRGFIPSHLAYYFSEQGHDVFGIDNNLHCCPRNITGKVRVNYGDIRYAEDVDKYVKEADIVYHMAAQINVDKSIEFPQETIDINFNGTMNILNACRRYDKKMVFASTSEIYGSHDEQITEDSALLAQSPYAVSKLAADKLCGVYHKLYGTHVYRVRCFNTFGPFQSADEYGAVIPKFVKAVFNDKPPIVFGDGKQRRDYIYIDDVVRAYEFIPTIPDLDGEPVNVGSGYSISVVEIAEQIISILGKDLKPLHIRARNGEVNKLKADTRLLKSFGFEKQIGFNSGLQQYIDWYKTYGHETY